MQEWLVDNFVDNNNSSVEDLGISIFVSLTWKHVKTLLALHYLQLCKMNADWIKITVSAMHPHNYRLTIKSSSNEISLLIKVRNLKFSDVFDVWLDNLWRSHWGHLDIGVWFVHLAWIY